MCIEVAAVQENFSIVFCREITVVTKPIFYHFTNDSSFQHRLFYVYWTKYTYHELEEENMFALILVKILQIAYQNKCHATSH